MILQLIVKGNASEARVACDYNGIMVLSATGHPRFNETIIRADDRFVHVAQKWFVASFRDDRRKPYPIGTLLWYGTLQSRRRLSRQFEVARRSIQPGVQTRRHGHEGLFNRHCDQCIEDGS